MRRRLSIFFAIIFPLLLGGGIYLLFRSKSLWMFAWAEALGWEGALTAAREWARPARPWLPDWVLFSLPTALYYLSVLNYCWECLRPDPDAARRWTMGVTALAFGVELLQIVAPVAGTFSVQDVLVYALVFPLSWPFRQGVLFPCQRYA